MTKKEPIVDFAKGAQEAALAKLELELALQTSATQTHQDEFAGQGGSYFIDPATNQRVKNLGETQHG